MRHGEASFSSLSGDHSRRLNEAGKNQVVSVSQKLDIAGFIPDKIFCSTSTRTAQTLEIYQETNSVSSHVYMEDKLYEASEDDFFQCLFQLEDKEKHILFVGHNPLWSLLATKLSRTYIGLQPSDAVVLQTDAMSWVEAVEGWELKQHIKA
jgi:phosphohistidine phosphatase